MSGSLRVLDDEDAVEHDAVDRQAPDRLAATPLGLAFLNDLQQMFLPDSRDPV